MARRKADAPAFRHDALSRPAAYQPSAIRKAHGDSRARAAAGVTVVIPEGVKRTVYTRPEPSDPNRIDKMAGTCPPDRFVPRAGSMDFAACPSRQGNQLVYRATVPASAPPEGWTDGDATEPPCA